MKVDVLMNMPRSKQAIGRGYSLDIPVKSYFCYMPTEWWLITEYILP